MQNHTVIASLEGGWEVRTPQAVRHFKERSEALEWAKRSLPREGGHILVSTPRRQVWTEKAA